MNDGCSCNVQINLLSYIANLKLNQCSLKSNDGKLCFDYPTNLVCGSPYISTDLYLRQLPSTVEIDIRNITLDTLIPIITRPIYQKL